MARKKKTDITENPELGSTVDESSVTETPAADNPAVVAENTAPEIGTPTSGFAENAEANVAAETAKIAEAAEDNTQNDDGTALADRVRVVSPLKLVLKRFFRSRLSVVGLSIFIAVLLFSFLGPLFMPWGEQELDNSKSVRIYYTYAYHVYSDESGEDIEYYSVSVDQPATGNKHAPAFSYGTHSDLKYPDHIGESDIHIFGTDKDGCDILVRLMYGGRLSLLLSFMCVLLYTIIGVILGGLAGYFGGWVDMIIMRIVDILNCIPSLPILLIVGAIYNGSSLDQDLRIYFMMGVLTLLSWTGTCRLVRGQILFLREQEYMVAAEALGFGVGRKIFKHLVPNVMPQLIVSMTLGLGGTVLTEASLSYLGLGAPPSTASLGQMVSQSTQQSLTDTYNYVIEWLPAGIVIILAVVAFNFIGDGLRDALDPKMKR